MTTLFFNSYALVPPVPSVLYSFTTFTFTNAGATGTTGPTSAALTAADGYNSVYPGVGTAYALTITSGIQAWTVPATGLYYFKIAGAGTPTATSSIDTIKQGLGVVMYATGSFTSGDVISILVGQMGTLGGDSRETGGSGGTFIIKTTPLFIAGGSGGPGYQGNSNLNGQTGTSGGTATVPSPGSVGGSGGNGATSPTATGSCGGAGGGYNTSGGIGTSVAGVGIAYVLGGTGGDGGASPGGPGGFGGGAGSGNGTGGGGGGYSGGTGGARGSAGNGGAGGGSFGTVTSAVASNTGHGYVIISTTAIL